MKISESIYLEINEYVLRFILVSFDITGIASEKVKMRMVMRMRMRMRMVFMNGVYYEMNIIHGSVLLFIWFLSTSKDNNEANNNCHLDVE